jgi:hypothetical protein
MKRDGIFLFTAKTRLFKTLWLSKNIAEFLHGLDPFGGGKKMVFVCASSLAMELSVEQGVEGEGPCYCVG